MFESWVDGKPFTSAARANLAWSPSPPFPQRKLNLEIQFPTVLRGLLAVFSIVNILSRSQFLPSPLTISMQIFTNYESIFSTVGEVSTPQTSRLCASVTNP